MKRLKTILGVTLLEVMLVLAIIAIIIVLSIRFYQSASSAQQATAALSQVQSIVAAADALTPSSDYSAASLPADIATYLHVPAGSNITMPWGATVTISGSANILTIDWDPHPADAVCLQISAQLQAPDLKNSYKIDSTTNCKQITYTKT